MAVRDSARNPWRLTPARPGTHGRMQPDHAVIVTALTLDCYGAAGGRVGVSGTDAVVLPAVMEVSLTRLHLRQAKTSTVEDASSPVHPGNHRAVGTRRWPVPRLDRHRLGRRRCCHLAAAPAPRTRPAAPRRSSVDRPPGRFTCWKKRGGAALSGPRTDRRTERRSAPRRGD